MKDLLVDMKYLEDIGKEGIEVFESRKIQYG